MGLGQPFIASRKLLAIDADADEFELTIAIGEPYEISEREWACPVSVQGLQARIPDMRGVDSWQAMQLAYQTAAQALVYFVEDGGRLLQPENREPIMPEDLLPRPAMRS